MEKRIIEAAVRRRQPLPDVIANAPELLLGLDSYFEAFVELSTCRGLGMASGPIPWTAVDRYAERHGYSGEGFEYLLQMIRAMDEAFLEHSRKNSQKAAESQEVS